jgi:hypothetical protein
MSCKAQQHLDVLQTLAKSKGHNRQLLLQDCPNAVIKTICECVLNVIKGNASVTRSQKSKLSYHKEELRKLAKKRVPMYLKRQILVQKGNGFLSILLPAAISLISSLIHGAS